MSVRQAERRYEIGAIDAVHPAAVTTPESTIASAKLSPRVFAVLGSLIVLVQAGVLFSVIRRGWYYNDDFALLMDASHRGLGWTYLKMPINDHLLPGLRLEFWLLRHTAPLNFGIAVMVRVVLQAASTTLLLVLLRTLLGPRRRVLLLVGLYALCPLVITNSLWLTVALSLLSAQVLTLAALVAHLRYVVSDNLRWAAIAGACLLGSALFWEKAAVSAILLPILSLGYLHEGSLLRRLGATIRQWRGWLLEAVPIIAFTGYFVAAGYGGATKSVAPTAMAKLIWMQWSRVVGASVLGGPWTWFNLPNVSLGYAQMSSMTVLASQLALLCLAVVGVRVVGWRSLIGWSIVLAPLAIGTCLVALGRYAFFGELIATTLRYSADLAVPLFLALALVLTPVTAAEVRRRVVGVPAEAALSPTLLPETTEPAGNREPPARTARIRRTRLPAPARRLGKPALRVSMAAAAVLWLVGAAGSIQRFDRHWGANPTHQYVRTLTANIRDAGPSLTLYDTTVSQSVLPIFFGPRWHLSDFLPLTGHVPALDGPATEPLIADDQGRLVPAVLVPATMRQPPAGGLCAYLAQGAGTWRIAFDKAAPEGDGFLRIDYLQQRPSVAEVYVEDDAGRLHAPITGSHVVFGYQLSHVTLRLPVTSVAAVVVRTQAADTHLCMGRLTVGAPFAIGGSK